MAISEDFRVGWIRGTVTRKGVGIRWGLPFFRVGRTPAQIWYISFSIPGSGISWIKYFNGQRHGGSTISPEREKENQIQWRNHQ